MIAALAVLGALASAEPGLDVRFSPAAPRLGDTISVFVKTLADAPAPTVSVGERHYRAFALQPGRYRAFVPASPLDKAGRWRIEVKAGPRGASVVVPVGPRRFGLQRIWIPGPRTDLDPLERAAVGKVKNLATPDRRWSGRFRKPTGGRISSPFGVRRYRNGVFLTDYYHRGIDYAPGLGATVVAPAAGRVVLVGLAAEGFRVHGNVVGVDHGHGVVSLFLHLLRATVREGDELQAGDPVGLVGGTGAVTAPHLHWGLYVNGVAVDPLPWIRQAVE